jgi:tetratricopeptide (TPR) repeat protein
MEDYELAAEEFSGAAALAPPGRDRCAALKAMGRALAASGDPAGSMRAYKRALAADPADPEAAILARGRGK